MCQFVCWDCWWQNWCGVCAGIHQAWGCCSFWLCKPAGLAVYDPNVCHCGDYDGNGYNCFNLGSVMWAPPSLLRWSKDLLEKKKTK